MSARKSERESVGPHTHRAFRTHARLWQRKQREGMHAVPWAGLAAARLARRFLHLPTMDASLL